MPENEIAKGNKQRDVYHISEMYIISARYNIAKIYYIIKLKRTIVICKILHSIAQVIGPKILILMLFVYYDMSRNSTIKVHCMPRLSVVRKSRCLLNNNCNKQKYNLAHNPRDACLYRSTITMMNLYVQSVVHKC